MLVGVCFDAVMGKVAGHSVIVRLKIEMTGRNPERAGHYDRHSVRKDLSKLLKLKDEY